MSAVEKLEAAIAKLEQFHDDPAFAGEVYSTSKWGTFSAQHLSDRIATLERTVGAQRSILVRALNLEVAGREPIKRAEIALADAILGTPA